MDVGKLGLQRVKVSINILIRHIKNFLKMQMTNKTKRYNKPVGNLHN